MRKALRKLRPTSKVWIELDGQPVFGDGKATVQGLVAEFKDF